MLDVRLRRLMRNVALGIPLSLGIPLASGCSSVDPSACDGQRDYTLSRAAIAADDAGTPASDCLTLCQNELAGQGLGSAIGVIDCEDVDDDAVLCETGCFARGRRPHEPVRARADAADAFFATIAMDELASVPAFERLADALRAHDAPAELVERARASAEDEARHATSMARLADLARLEVTSPRGPTPSLLALALHNAREGCVGEAYAALEAAHVAGAAAHAHVREAFAEIARDEARHALLSLDVDRWARRQLGPAATASLDRARRDALAELRVALYSRETPQGAGLPDSATREVMLASLAA